MCILNIINEGANSWLGSMLSLITSSFVVTFFQTFKKVGMEDLGAKVGG